MKNNITNIIVGCIAVAAAVFAVAVVVGGHRAGDGGAGATGGAAQGASGLAGAGKVGNAAPDQVSVSSAPGGDTDDEIVTDETVGYSFTMPTNWYLEPNAGAGVTVYPDYDPASGDPAACKIEISEIAGDADAGSTSNLNSWITAYLHADPTADVSETARTDITLGTSTAIEWQGALNGVSTTLVYAPAPDGSSVLEFAPSTLAEDDASETADGSETDDCTIELQALLANFTFSS